MITHEKNIFHLNNYKGFALHKHDRMNFHGFLYVCQVLRMPYNLLKEKLTIFYVF